MKKNVIIGIATLIIVVGLAYGAYNTSASQGNPKLAVDEVKELVTAQYPGKINGVELEKKGSQLIYKVDVENGNIAYEIKIDGDTGEIIKLNEKMLTDKQKTNEENDQSEVTQEEVESSESKDNTVSMIEEEPADDTQAAESNNKTPDSMIGIEKAIKIAQEEFDGVLKEAELEKNNDHYTYEIELIGKDKEADFDIDAYTGEVLSKKTQTKYKNKHIYYKSKKGAISLEKALDIAQSEFPGTITEIELDKNNGRLIYEIEIKANGKEADFDIDAYSGKIISIEIDND